jgi:EAL domain-containing protein (putative c-di-GMP-specific phosphodiesterase class I)
MVCAQIEQWIAMNLPLVPVSFNVSASEFNHGDVRSQLARCIERHHLHPDELEIELTESTLVDESGDAMNALAEIRKMGVKCLVDDFGTGFSSLSQLQRLDTDILKIDQSFTAQLGRTKKAETFFRAIVSMADALEMGVVAEGVETIEQLHLLQLLGCKEVQGYYMCPPVPGPKMAELLRKRFMMTREGVLL